MRISRTTITLIGATAAMALAPVTIAQARHGGDDNHNKKNRVELESTKSKPITVQSFDGTTLTLTRGTATVSGAVLRTTEIKCESTASAARHGRGRDDKPGHDQGDDHGAHAARHGADDPAGDDNGGGNEPGDDNGGDDDAPVCDSSSLKPGASVREAKLVAYKSGWRFDEIELGAARSR